MMISLRFDFRDIFRANRIAFSWQRIGIQFIGLTAGYLVYLVFTYISVWVSGEKLITVWNEMGLLPCLAAYTAPWYGWLIFVIGSLFFLVTYLITSTAVSRATYMLLKGNNFYTWRDAFSFAFKKSSSVLLAPLAIVILISFFVIGGMVVGLLGKIPFVGEIGFSLFYLFWILAGLILVLFIIALGVSLLLAPAIIATTDEDAFEAMFQSFSMFWTQPWRLILYTTLSAALSIAGFVVFAYLVKKGFLLTDYIFVFAMGEKYINLMSQGMYLLTQWVSITIGWMNSLFGDVAALFYFNREFLQLNVPVILNITAYVFSIMMLILGGWVVSYGVSTFQAGMTLTYILLRKRKENDNLLERKDKEEEDEEEVEEKATEKVEEKTE